MVAVIALSICARDLNAAIPHYYWWTFKIHSNDEIHFAGISRFHCDSEAVQRPAMACSMHHRSFCHPIIHLFGIVCSVVWDKLTGGNGGAETKRSARALHRDLFAVVDDVCTSVELAPSSDHFYFRSCAAMCVQVRRGSFAVITQMREMTRRYCGIEPPRSISPSSSFSLLSQRL